MIKSCFKGLLAFKCDLVKFQLKKLFTEANLCYTYKSSPLNDSWGQSAKKVTGVFFPILSSNCQLHSTVALQLEILGPWTPLITPEQWTCHDISWHVMTYHYMTCHVMTCHDISWHDMSWHVMPWHIMTCHDISWHVMTYHDMSWHIMAYVAMSCHAMSERSILSWEGCVGIKIGQLYTTEGRNYLHCEICSNILNLIK